MGIQCSQPQNSMLVFSTLNAFDEKEQQIHQANQTLNYSFPQKQILESIKTKLQLQQEQHLPRQPDDPGSPVQALSEISYEDSEFTKFHNSCPTTIRINRRNSNQFTIQHNKTLSINDLNLNLIILKIYTFLHQFQINKILKQKRVQQKKVYKIISNFKQIIKLTIDILVILNLQTQHKQSNLLDFQQQNKYQQNWQEPQAYVENSQASDQIHQLFIVIVINLYITKLNSDNFEYNILYIKIQYYAFQVIFSQMITLLYQRTIKLILSQNVLLIKDFQLLIELNKFK